MYKPMENCSVTILPRSPVPLAIRIIFSYWEPDQFRAKPRLTLPPAHKFLTATQILMKEVSIFRELELVFVILTDTESTQDVNSTARGSTTTVPGAQPVTAACFESLALSRASDARRSSAFSTNLRASCTAGESWALRRFSAASSALLRSISFASSRILCSFSEAIRSTNAYSSASVITFFSTFFSCAAPGNGVAVGLFGVAFAAHPENSQLANPTTRITLQMCLIGHLLCLLSYTISHFLSIPKITFINKAFSPFFI